MIVSVYTKLHRVKSATLHIAHIVFAALESKGDSRDSRFAEKPGGDGEAAAVPPLKKQVELSVFGRVSGPADRCAEVIA